MLESTFELISMAASNSHMIFCLFNLIIAVLVVGSSKSNDKNIINHGNGDKKSVSFPNKVTDTPVEGACTDKGGEGKEAEDLKRRVEEFIQKMNEGWREDKVKAYSIDK